MTVKVYHIKREKQDKEFVRDYVFKPDTAKAEILWLTDSMELVAEVEGSNDEHHVPALEWAFRLTNTIYRNWWENEGVKCIKQSYSTSVGDIMQYGNDMYMVDRFGFAKMEMSGLI